MALDIRKATKEQARLRMAIHAPSGAGKTMTALLIAKAFGRVLLIDTERGSSEKYAHLDFEVARVAPPYNPRILIEELPKIEGFDVVIIDGLSPFWNGAGGLLELHDEEVRRQVASGRKVDTFAAWKNITPIYRRMVDAILSCPAHVITTMRAKTEYERDDKGKIQKKGFAPEMRDQFDYELDIETSMVEDDGNHYMAVRKSRCSELAGKTFKNPGSEVAIILKDWLDGAPAAKPLPKATPQLSQFDILMKMIEAKQIAGFSQRVIEARDAGLLTKDEVDQIRKAYEVVKTQAPPAIAAVPAPAQSQPKVA
jgi:hypothetical protein